MISIRQSQSMHLRAISMGEFNYNCMNVKLVESPDGVQMQLQDVHRRSVINAMLGNETFAPAWQRRKVHTNDRLLPSIHLDISQRAHHEWKNVGIKALFLVVHRCDQCWRSCAPKGQAQCIPIEVRRQVLQLEMPGIRETKITRVAHVTQHC
jgi:hypothetical protein